MERGPARESPVFLGTSDVRLLGIGAVEPAVAPPDVPAVAGLLTPSEFPSPGRTIGTKMVGGREGERG